MSNQNERRKYGRMDICCRLTYKFPGEGRESSGECINISGAGISFRGTEPLTPGLALEIVITPDNPLKLSLQAFAEVTRSTRIAPYKYEISCEIKGIK
jgi:hypothetical protein